MTSVAVASNVFVNPLETNRYDRLDRRTLERAKTLMHQQLYVLGRDIESSHGNLLMMYGAKRVASPLPGIPSLYIFRFRRRTSIAFRGFGVFVGDERTGGIFVHRYLFEPRWMPSCRFEPIAWLPKELTRTRRPRGVDDWKLAYNLIFQLIDWFVEYEQWVRETFGRRLRTGQLVRFRLLKNAILNWDMVVGWSSIKAELQGESK